MKRNSNKPLIESSPKDFFLTKNKITQKKIYYLRALFELILKFFIKYLIKKFRALILYWANFLALDDQTKSSATHCKGVLCEKNVNTTIFGGYNVSNCHI